VSQQEKRGSGQQAGPRVLVLPSWWYPNRNAPRSGIFIRRQAAAVASLCPTAVLFVSQDASLRGRREIESSFEEGLATVRVYYRPAPSSPWRPLLDSLRFLKAAAAGRRALPVAFRAPDLVHVQVTPPVGLVLFLRLFFRRTPVVFSEHWSKYLLPPERENPLRTWFIRRFCARCAALTAVSDLLARGMEAHGLKAPLRRVIGNPVDPDVFQPPPGGRRNAPAGAAILHVSSLTENKQAAGILRATALLARRRPNISLLVIGDGPMRSPCEELAGELGLLGRVARFQDPLPEAKVAERMRQADILVLFSRIETFACVAAEALSCGLAVVSTPTAVAEYLPEASGALVPFGDEEALAAALERMIDRLPTFDGTIGRRAVSERFAPPEIGRRFRALFMEVLGQGRL
jgi:glycosyltransferase involved in cell wall biosynthesis